MGKQFRAPYRISLKFSKLIPNKCASSVYILRKLFLLVDQCQQRQYCLSISCWITFDMMRTCLHRTQRVIADALG